MIALKYMVEYIINIYNIPCNIKYKLKVCIFNYALYDGDVVLSK